MRQVGRQSFFVLAVMAAASVSLMACPASLDDECAEGACDPDARVDGGGDAEDASLGPCAEHPTDPACIDDSSALFVSPSGNDDGAGTREAPLKTLGAALEKVSDAQRRIYVCEGTYEANVEIKVPVAITGGVSCAWEPTKGRAMITPSKGIALRVINVSGPVVLQDLEVLGSADPNVKGDSAIAVFVSGSTDVTFRNAVLTAGAGTSGEKGASRSNYSGAATPGGGNQAGTAGLGPKCKCVDGTKSNGGNGAAGDGTGLTAGTAEPDVGGINVGSSSLVTCGDGTVGAAGLAKGPGDAVVVPGTLTATGWSSSTAPIDAPNGNPGQGGGGGGAKMQGGMNAGGGGGCGGCGGAGARSGTNGGSSFALLSFNSSIVLESSDLTAGVGGKGGNGGDGQDGQKGGDLGVGACNGGPGGPGAGGSGGSGGAGGHAIPIGFVGKAPTATGGHVTPGTKGGGGTGGAPGGGDGKAGTVGAPGPDGKAQDSLAL